jgi:aspartokinase
VPVVTGFLGADAAGRTTLLGRGSSDTSATWLGAALGAERVEIWTDVDGVLSADPRLVPSARRLPRLSYEQAADLAAFGAKVLHARAMAPVAGLGIPVCVRNTFAPGAAGTQIGPQTAPFEAAPLDPTLGLEAEPPQRGLAACRPPWLRNGLAVVALIGADGESTASLREELHEALLAVGIRPVGTGTSERGGVAVLASADLERAVPAVHDRLILGREPGAGSRTQVAASGEGTHANA